MKLGRFCGIVDLGTEKCSFFLAKITVSTYSNVEIGRTEEKKDQQFGSVATFQFGISPILFSEFDSLVGYRTEKEG